MTITFEMSGGFAHLPALSRPVTIDTAQIEAQARTELESLVRQSRFFDQPTPRPRQKGLPTTGLTRSPCRMVRVSTRFN